MSLGWIMGIYGALIEIYKVAKRRVLSFMNDFWIYEELEVNKFWMNELNGAKLADF